MVTPDDQKITLELTVDKAELERQLGEVFGGKGGPAGGPGGGRGKDRLSFLSDDEKKQLSGFREQKRAKSEQAELSSFLKPTSGESGKGIAVNPGAGFVKHLKSLGALFGIAVGITALVRQSKLLGEASKAFNSIMGAMVDMFIAPFMPMIAKALMKIAGLIPVAGDAGQKVMDTIDRTKRMVSGDDKSGAWMEWLKGWKKEFTDIGDSLMEAKGDSSWRDFAGFSKRSVLEGTPWSQSKSSNQGGQVVVVQLTQEIHTAAADEVGDSDGEVFACIGCRA